MFDFIFKHKLNQTKNLQNSSLGRDRLFLLLLLSLQSRKARGREEKEAEKVSLAADLNISDYHQLKAVS